MPKHPNFPAETAHIIHFTFEWLAVFIGVWLYRRQTRINHSPKAPLGVLIGCLLGAGIGNKLLFLIEVPQAIAEYGWLSLTMGQTIVGGLLGGLIGVEIAKKILKIKQSTGDNFVFPLVVAIIIGRTGCFLAGLYDGTYGIATTLPWGVDFGDGIIRHPTQIYEQLFVITIMLILWHFKPQLSAVSGLQFKCFLSSYLLWRTLIDSIKPIPYDYWGLSGIQLSCIIALIFYLPITYQAIITIKKSQNDGTFTKSKKHFY